VLGIVQMLHQCGWGRPLLRACQPIQALLDFLSPQLAQDAADDAAFPVEEGGRRNRLPHAELLQIVGRGSNPDRIRHAVFFQKLGNLPNRFRIIERNAQKDHISRTVLPLRPPRGAADLCSFDRIDLNMKACRIAIVLACAANAFAANLQDAVAAIGRGDFSRAEHLLRVEVLAHPGEAPALSLLGAVLDSQNKIREADTYHRRALALAPASIDVLGNYGNHLIAAGDEEAALRVYQKITKLNPENPGANLQLTQLALKRKKGKEALAYLEHVPDAVLNDSRLTFSLGVGFANAGEFREAEVLFTRVLQAAPADFNVLFNLGAVAAAAGDYQRSREALEAALRQQPANVDVLYRLAETDRALHRDDAALALLARAAKAAPERADVQKLLAAAAADLGALEDALAAWDRYLKSAPNDDAARRERAFTIARLGKTAEGLAELHGYVQRHTSDPIGYYQLGIVESQNDPAAALAAFDQAISLRPDFPAARSARGALYYQLGKPEAGLTDLQMAAQEQPDDAGTLDHLGQTYLALDRIDDAVRVLRRAAALAPADSTVQLHFGRALAQAGDLAESKIVMDRFRQLGPQLKRGIPAGFVDYLTLSPEERQADYRARVQKAVREHPEDAAGQLDYFNLLLDDGKLEEASAAAQRLSALHPPPTPKLAIANARLLEAQGRLTDAIAILEQAREKDWNHPELCWREVALWTRLKRFPDALRAIPETSGEDELLLLRASVMELAGYDADAQRSLDELQRRRPEWAPLWVVRASILSARGNLPEASKAWETAKALGAQTAQIQTLENLLKERRPAEW
jgi:tetratricopeptide (TPR) repeat protein